MSDYNQRTDLTLLRMGSSTRALVLAVPCAECWCESRFGPCIDIHAHSHTPLSHVVRLCSTRCVVLDALMHIEAACKTTAAQRCLSGCT